MTRPLHALLPSDGGVAHLAISVDATIADAQSALARMQAAAPGAVLLFDEHSAWASRFAVESVPTILLVDVAGLVRFRHNGHLNAEDLLTLSRAIAGLNEKPAGGAMP